jgi:SecD/SecF fusion protein
MNRKKNTWKWAFIAILLAWSFWEMYPPQARDLVEVFKEESIKSDETFKSIVARAEQLRKEQPTRGFGNLIEAVGTNDLRPYFVYNIKPGKDSNRAILNELQKRAAGKIKLGLDLQGGIQFVVSLDTNRIQTASATDTNAPSANSGDKDRTRAVEQAIEVLRKRVDKFGVAEPVIQPAGADRILIQLPGLSEADKDTARTQIQKAAFLEFRLVHPESRRLLQEGIIEPGYEVLNHREKSPEAAVESVTPYLVEKRPTRGLTGKYVKRANVFRDPYTATPKISFELKGEGIELFAEVTRENVGRQLAIVLDGEIYSAPNIQGEIPGGHGEITLGSNPNIEEAFTLAQVLENPLETPVKIEEVREVDPSLGKDSIASGIRASIVGVIAVAGFMAIYYLLAGLVANVALIMNIIILMGVMCYFNTTLTLPGIAGIVLTVGMAVDANVLIFERIREESAAGKSVKGALAAGYDKAFSTIFDSHVTTLISSIILIFMGTGPVQGFGVTLTIGVALSLFTALFVTRVIFDFLIDRGLLKQISMLHIIRASDIPFMKLAKPAFILSWLLIIVGLGYGIHRGKDIFGTDFIGGDRTTLAFAQKIEPDKLREVVTSLKVGDATIQYQKDIGSESQNLLVTTEAGTSDKVLKALQEKFPDAKFRRVALDQVGPSVGKEIQKTAIVASFISMMGILIYVAFRYEFSFSVGAVIAIVHDVLMTIGWFFLTGRQLSAPMVAAILTIIGFSINDTIVIFDRIREDLRLGVKGTFSELINRALNQTLSRTIITSGTVFLATLSLYLFGGGVINDFAFTFLVGIITGTYSSIYIASALVLWWHKGERPKSATAPTLSSNNPTPVKARV